jgi:hypothetical protein
MAPKGEADRILFDKIHNYQLRYSFSPTEKDKFGEYRMSSEEAAKFLRAEVRELKDLDGTVNLEYLRASEDIDSPEHDYRVGVYRFVWPKIKQLNDLYLGPGTTDEFTKKLNETIHRMLGSANFRPVRRSYKGGAFLIDFSSVSQEEMASMIADVQEAATEILHGFALEKLLYQQEQLERIRTLLSAYDAGELEIVDGKITTEEGQEIVITDEVIKDYRGRAAIIEKHVTALNELLDQIDTGNGGSKQVKVSFGFDSLGDGAEGSFNSLRNAEVAANISSVRAETPGRLMFFSNKELMVEGINAMHMLHNVVTGKGEIRKDWRRFFYVGETGFYQMNPEMIKIYRKVEDYRKGKEYQEMSERQRRMFEDQIVFFGEYYERINVIDVLKPFRADSYGVYFQRVRDIVDLIRRAETELQKIERLEADYNAVRACLEDTSAVLELSLKDEGAEIVRTTRAAIKAILEGGDKLLAFCDNIGFGGENQASYETSFINLVKMLGFTPLEWKMAAFEGEAQERLIEEKLTDVEQSDAFLEESLKIGDHGTTIIRNNESGLYYAFKGKAVIDADGGDETRSFWAKKENSFLPEGETVIRANLLALARRYKLRISAVFTDFTLPKIEDPKERKAISDEQRSRIVALMEFFTWADHDHEKSKAAEEMGKRRIGLRID